MRMLEEYLDGVYFKRRYKSTTLEAAEKMSKLMEEINNINQKKDMLYQCCNSCLEAINNIEGNIIDGYQKYHLCMVISNSYIELENAINKAIEEIYYWATKDDKEEPSES